VPAANLTALDIPEGKSIFEAIERGSTVNSVTFNVKTGEVLVGVAMIHQELLDRYSPATSIDDVVRADIFSNRKRIEFDTWRAAAVVDGVGVPDEDIQAWNNIFDAIEVFRRIGLAGKDWTYAIDGEIEEAL